MEWAQFFETNYVRYNIKIFHQYLPPAQATNNWRLQFSDDITMYGNSTKIRDAKV